MQHKRGVSVKGVLEDFCIANLKIFSFISLGGCISFNDSDGFPVATHCPFSAGSQKMMTIRLNESHSFCKYIYRLGRLCSKCKVGYGIAVFSSNFKCVPCKESYKNWLKYFAIEFVPLTILFLIVLIFHVGITSAATNAFIFFSQLVSLPLEVSFRYQFVNWNAERLIFP